MKACELNEMQKTHTLAAKKQKKKTKKAVRNVLASSEPKMIVKFPGYILSEEECVQFEENLLQFHTYTPEPKPQWCDIKHYSKEQRREMRKTQRYDIPSRGYIALGFNEATRAVENRVATVAILAKDNKPEILNKHFYQCCKLYNIPLLKVQNLKEMSKKCFGFPSMAMAFREVPKNGDVYNFYKYLQKFFNRMNYGILKMRTEKQIVTTSVSSEKSEKIKNVVHTPIIRHLHLKRPDPNKRSYVPERNSANTFNVDFVPFSQTSSEDTYVPFENEEIVELKKSVKIKNLKIKRLQPNPKRKKHNKKKH